jgi:hypothetical protein
VSNHKEEEEGEDGESEDPSDDILAVALSGMHTGKIQAEFGPFSLPC